MSKILLRGCNIFCALQGELKTTWHALEEAKTKPALPQKDPRAKRGKGHVKGEARPRASQRWDSPTPLSRQELDKKEKVENKERSRKLTSERALRPRLPSGPACLEESPPPQGPGMFIIFAKPVPGHSKQAHWGFCHFLQRHRFLAGTPLQLLRSPTRVEACHPGVDFRDVGWGCSFWTWKAHSSI